MDTCVFCEQRGEDFPPEHWTSQWISRATIPEGKGVEHHVPGRDPWVHSAMDLTVEHVCPDCNHHWMSDIESAARDIALPLIEGGLTPRTFTSRQRKRLAIWSFMKLITLELGRPPYERATYPPEMYTGFKRFLQPPAGCVILIGHRELHGDPPLFLWFRSQGQEQETNVGGLPGFRSMLTIKHLVVDMVGVFHAPAIQLEDSDDRLIEIWPERGDAVWPPPAHFTRVRGNDLV